MWPAVRTGAFCLCDSLRLLRGLCGSAVCFTAKNAKNRKETQRHAGSDLANSTGTLSLANDAVS